MIAKWFSPEKFTELCYVIKTFNFFQIIVITMTLMNLIRPANPWKSYKLSQLRKA
jgi:hypothetical protein